MNRFTRAAATVTTAALGGLLLTACVETGGGSSDPTGDALKPGDQGTPTIAAATELEDLAPVLEDAQADLGFDIEMHYPGGTVENSQALKAGKMDGQYDATWFATNRYVELIGAGDKLGEQTSVANSPVAFGVSTEKARELGWTDHQPTWEEIGTAAADRELTYGMTDPSSSNSGFSALVSVATAFAGTGQALTTGDLEQIGPRLEEFFAGQTMSSGSSGWLRDTFLNQPERADAVVNYESVLHGIRAEDGADLEVILPADGVVTADYPLSELAAPGDAAAAEQTAQLAEWLLENQDRVNETHRRPVDATAQVPEELSDQLLVEAPFPGDLAVTDQLIDSYLNRWRPRGDTTFILDVSGSMSGGPLDELKSTMSSLIDGSARTTTGEVGLRDQEFVTLRPFNTAPQEPAQTDLAETGGKGRAQLESRIDELQAGGGTDLYPALEDAYRDIEDRRGEDPEDNRIATIVVLTDGVVEPRYEDFVRFCEGLSPEARKVPVFTVLYGAADEDEMTRLAELTGGKVFDAREDGIGEVFKEIRAYQ